MLSLIASVRLQGLVIELILTPIITPGSGSIQLRFKSATGFQCHTDRPVWRDAD